MCFETQTFPCRYRAVRFQRKKNPCQNKPECLCPEQTCLETEAEVLTFRQQYRKYMLSLMTTYMLLYMAVNVMFITVLLSHL